MEVVGEAADGGAAVDLTAELAVDVVVMDVMMRGIDGVEATCAIVEAGNAKVLALSAYVDHRVGRNMLAAGQKDSC